MPSGALIWGQMSGDWELVLKLIDSPIDQQTSGDWKLLLELIDSPIDQQTSGDWSMEIILH